MGERPFRATPPRWSTHGVDVLVLGGSVFLGRAMVSEAVADGHSVTVFHRGVSGSEPPGARVVHGDRTVAADLDQLTGTHYDLVIDTCGYVPSIVGLSVAALEPVADHYVFVSSVNAWPGWPEQPDYHLGGVHDGDPDASEAPPELTEAGPYGWLKVGCERAVERAFGPQRTTVLRAGCIVGLDDSAVGRLPWWVDRAYRGGEILVPGSPEAPVSLVDARDIARFALLRVPGTFEASGPYPRDTRADLMAALLAATEPAVRADGREPGTLVYVDEDWLSAQGVEAWTEIPLWVSAKEGPSVFVHDPGEAEAAGFRWRPLAETVTDTWAWQQSVAGGWKPGARTPGLDPAREQNLIEAWRSR